MRPIVCATRGGQASRRTQEQAIALAKEQGTELVFLCVVNPAFAGPLGEPLAAALEDELQRLARSLLTIARARAGSQGVRAQTVVLSGPVQQSIQEYLCDVDASALVIGAPKSETVPHGFGPQEVRSHVEAIGQAAGVEVVQVP